MNKKAIFSLVMFIIVFLIVILCFFLPWYNVHMVQKTDNQWTGSSITITDTNYRLTDAEAEYNINNQKKSMSISYNDIAALNTEGLTDYITPVYNTTFWLMILTAIFLTCTIILLFLDIFSRDIFMRNISRQKKKYVKIFCIVSLIFIVITISIFAIRMELSFKESIADLSNTGGEVIPSEFNNIHFWSNINYEGIGVTSGPSYSWYLLCFSLVIGIIGYFLYVKSQKFQMMHNQTLTMQQPTQNINQNMEFCKYCRAVIPEDSMFCIECGKKLK